MPASKKTIALAKAAARKAGTLPAREPRERRERRPRAKPVKRWAVADLEAGSLVLYNGAPCIMLENHAHRSRLANSTAVVMLPDGRRVLVGHQHLSIPPEGDR